MGDSEESRLLVPSIEGNHDTVPDDSDHPRKNTRTACVNCKSRKLKCSGQSPCNHCSRRGIPCLIDEEGDQRRKHGLKRKVDTLEDKGKLLDRLVTVLQHTDKTFAAQTMNLIRSNASLDEIQMFMDDIMNMPRLEKTPELIDTYSGVQKWSESHKKAMLARPDPKELSDMLLFKVPAKPWTSVTNDNEFVSHLISLWFTWCHPFMNFIDRDLFIRDMKAGDIESEFCSPFLVNIILASACSYSDFPEAYAVSSEPWSRGLHFYKEARQHLDESDGKLSIHFAAGLGVLYVFSCLIGKDRLGWIYLSQLAYCVQEITRKRSPLGPDADEDARRNAKAVDNAIWGLCNLASMTALAYQKGALIKIPESPHDYDQREAHRDKWCNYPRSPERIKSHTQCLFNSFCDLSVIMHDLSWSLFGEEGQTLTVELVALVENGHQRLRSWYKGLSSCLAIEGATPHVLSFHLQYHTLIQTIFGLLQNTQVNKRSHESDDDDDDDDDDDASDNESKRRWAREVHQRAKEMCLKSARENGRLIELYRDLWGLNNVPPVNAHWITVSMFTLLEGLDEKENCDSFISLCVAAKSHANHWALGKAMLRLVQVTARHMGVSLPPETNALFKHFETRIWSAEDRKDLSSQYPNYARSMKQGERDDIEMDAFLAKFDDLYLPEEEPGAVDEVKAQSVESSPGGTEVGRDAEEKSDK